MVKEMIVCREVGDFIPNCPRENRNIADAWI